VCECVSVCVCVCVRVHVCTCVYEMCVSVCVYHNTESVRALCTHLLLAKDVGVLGQKSSAVSPVGRAETKSCRMNHRNE